MGCLLGLGSVFLYWIDGLFVKIGSVSLYWISGLFVRIGSVCLGWIGGLFERTRVSLSVLDRWVVCEDNGQFPWIGWVGCL